MRRKWARHVAIPNVQREQAGVALGDSEIDKLEDVDRIGLEDSTFADCSGP